MLELEVPLFRESSFGPLMFVPLVFGSLNYRIWPSIRVFGAQNLGGTNIKGTNLKSLIFGKTYLQ